MPVTLIIGAQWGDEGKGKIIDVLSKDSHYVIRFHGGNNAGHTVINQFGKFGLHLIPSGIFTKKATALITNGTVLDLEVLLEEIEQIEKAGIQVKNRLIISPRCHIIMPYHKLLDKLYEEAKGKGKTGTTGRGIGPVYADKVSYNGIRLYDLLNPRLFSQKLQTQLTVKNKIITALGEKALSQKEIEKQFAKFRQKLKPYVKEAYPLIQQALEKKQRILLEGAQGMFLDNDWGTYPFVTASTIVTGGANAGAGIAPRHIKNVVGVVKAYTTRVGSGPFPTELVDKIGEKLRSEGAEFGVTTGRARRCGWFDAQLIRFAAQINGFTDIAITKLDVLDTFEEIKVCIGYTLNGKPVSYVDGDVEFLTKIKPVYKTMKGWNTNTKGTKEYNKLPGNAKKYLQELKKLIGTKISYVSTGEKREDIIIVK
ncbi:MAG: adenylosuccinate synthase [Candidatus Levybacteria bacterium]|nr:adenylosuccinate synthase [Candidatus Levybacteria bacterium]